MKYINVFFIILIFSAPAEAAKNNGAFFLEGGAEPAFHYNQIDTDSTPPSSIFTLARGGFNFFPLQIVGTYAKSVIDADASYWAAGFRLRFLSGQIFSAKAAMLGLHFDYFDYTTEAPIAPKNYLTPSTGFRYGGYLQAFMSKTSYMSLQVLLGRVSDNMFLFPSLNAGIEF